MRSLDVGCAADCTADEDDDGVTDRVDDCVGALDACGICNGPGEIYECGCTGIPAGIAIARETSSTPRGRKAVRLRRDAVVDGVRDDVNDRVSDPTPGVCGGHGADVWRVRRRSCWRFDREGNQLDDLDEAVLAQKTWMKMRRCVCDVTCCVGVFDACSVDAGP